MIKHVGTFIELLLMAIPDRFQILVAMTAVSYNHLFPRIDTRLLIIQTVFVCNETQ